MATTAGDILTKVQALGYGTDTEAAQIVGLDSVHKRVCNTRRWRFLLDQEDIGDTRAGTGTYALDTLDETRQVDAVRINNTTDKYLLEHEEFDMLRDREHIYRDTGIPQYWAVIGTDLHLWPIPDGVYEMTVDYVIQPAALTLTTDTISIPDSHADILVWLTLMNVTFRERDWDGHNFARQMYAELLAEMLAQFGITDRQTAKHVISSGFHDKFDPDQEPWLT
jgi:hypothetical protein